MCYNNYPLWPEYISYNFESPGDEIKSVTTTTSSTEDDFAETLTVALGIILVF